MTSHHDLTSSLTTSVLTAGAVALVPDDVMSYAGKILSVFVLAMAAEAGRRLLGYLWKVKK